jgi:integral membrane sensor domain MASE1
LLRQTAFALAYLTLAAVSMQQRDAITLSTFFWPPAGILLAVLMLTPPRQWPSWMVIAATLHFLTGTLLGHRSLAIATVFVVNDLLVCSAVAAAWRRCCPARHTLTTLVNTLWFIFFLVIFTLAFSWLVWLGLYLIVPTISATHWYIWSLAGFVGCLITTPVIFACSHVQWRQLAQQNLFNLWLGLFAAFALLVGTTLVFNSPLQFTPGRPGAPFDLTYGPLLFLTLVTISWGPMGSSIIVAGLALVAGSYTMSGLGPYAGAADFNGEPLLALQGYLGSAALLSLLAGALMRDRERALQKAAKLKTQLDAALHISGYVAWEYQPPQAYLHWLGQFPFPFAAAETGKTPLTTWLDALHPDDRKKARAWLDADATIFPGQPLQCRVRADDGIYRQVEMTGSMRLQDHMLQEAMMGLLGAR